jgi:hypothetical protein
MGHESLHSTTTTAGTTTTGRRLIWRYGALSAAVLVGLAAIHVPLSLDGTIPFSAGRTVGYASMVLAFVVVFFGIRAYRDEVAGGVLPFGRAFKVGMLMTLIVCAAYVVSWQIAYRAFFPDFLDTYGKAYLADLEQGGATAAELTAARTEMGKFAELYENPLFNVAITLLEVLPVGLIVTLVSAAILRRKTPAPPARRDLTVAA